MGGGWNGWRSLKESWEKQQLPWLKYSAAKFKALPCHFLGSDSRGPRGLDFNAFFHIHKIPFIVVLLVTQEENTPDLTQSYTNHHFYGFADNTSDWEQSVAFTVLQPHVVCCVRFNCIYILNPEAHSILQNLFIAVYLRIYLSCCSSLLSAVSCFPLGPLSLCLKNSL